MGFFKDLRLFLTPGVVRREKGASAQKAGSGPRLGAASLFACTGGDPLTVAAVYRCVNFLADSVANLPLQYLVNQNGVYEEDTKSRLHYLLTVSPNPAISAVDFWALVVRYMLLDGNAYIVPVYNGASLELERLALPSPGAVMYDQVNGIYTVNDPVAGIAGTYKEEEILHFKNFTYDGKTGISTVAFARGTIETALAGDRETKERFSNGGAVRGIVSNDGGAVRGFGEYQDSELNKTAESIDQKFKNGERIVSLPGQANFNALSMNSADMQFLQSRDFTVREVCRWFGVHPSFVFDDDATNYKSAEMANVAFLSATLNPILSKIEGELQRKLISPALAFKHRLKFDRRGIYACDLASRVKYQAQTIAAGIYTVNEWRALENKPAIEGGDTVLVSANLRPIVPEDVGKAK